MINKQSKKKSGRCRLLWEITSRCDYNCKHCFLGNRKRPLELSHKKCLEVLGDFRRFILRNNFTGVLSLTGGNPVLRKDFWDILEIAGEYQRSGVIKDITISGNPFYADKKLVSRLKSLKHVIYRLSLDGLEKNHDFMRKKGSFKNTIKTLECLKKEGIKTAVAMTLCRLNADDLTDVIKLMIKKEVDRFSFDVLSIAGNAEGLKKYIFTPEEYRKILLKTLKILDALPKKNKSFMNPIVNDEQLFSRIFYEKGRLREYKKIINDKSLSSSAYNDNISFAVCANGVVYPRRLIPVKIGRVPRDSFESIYKSSVFFDYLSDKSCLKRKKAKSTKCRKCPVIDYCGLGRASIHHQKAAHEMCWVK